MANEKRLIDLGDALRMVKNSREDCPETSICGRAIWDIAHKCALSCLTSCDTVDAVEVVRCKDCKHFCAEHIDRGICELERDAHGTSAVWYIDDFCSYGERRAEDG